MTHTLRKLRAGTLCKRYVWQRVTWQQGGIHKTTWRIFYVNTRRVEWQARYNVSASKRDASSGVNSSVYWGLLEGELQTHLPRKAPQSGIPLLLCQFSVCKTEFQLRLQSCLSVRMAFFFEHFPMNGRYIRSLQMIFVRRIRPFRTLDTETYHTTRQI